jgi:hypothetical protein
MNNRVQEVITSASMSVPSAEQRFAIDEVLASVSLLRKILHRVLPVRDEGPAVKTFTARSQKAIAEVDGCNSQKFSENEPLTIPRRERGHHTYLKNRNNKQ